MIMMDLLSTNKTLGRYLALVALFALLPSLLILNVPWMTVYAGVLIAYAAVLSAQMTDERNGWERFRQALPLTRAQVVAGRAAFVAIGAFVGTALGVLVYLGACAVRQRHIDQAQSMNLYITNDYTFRRILDLYLMAWELGVKTVYYIRSRSLEVEECEVCSS